MKERSYEQEVPFGYPRFTGSLRLPGAFRSLARPSSAPEPSHPPNSGVSRKLFDFQHTSRLHMISVTGPCHCEATASPGISTLPLRRLAASRVHVHSLLGENRDATEALPLSREAEIRLQGLPYLTVRF